MEIEKKEKKIAIGDLAKTFVESYKKTNLITNIEKKQFPSRINVIRITEELREILFPGYIGRTSLNWLNVEYYEKSLKLTVKSIHLNLFHKPSAFRFLVIKPWLFSKRFH